LAGAARDCQLGWLLIRLLEAVNFSCVFSDHFLASGRRHRLDEFPQLLHVVSRMIEVWEIRGPEKFVSANEFDYMAKGFFVRIAGNPALTVKVVARLFF